MEALQSIPPFTRVYGIIVIAISLTATLQLINPIYLIYIPSLVFKKGEIWRLFTAPFFLGKLDFNFIVYMLTSFMFVSSLEANHFQKRTSNLVFIFILNVILVLIISSILISFSIGRSVLISIEYLYSKLFSQGVVRLFMIIPVPAAYLPFVNIVFAVLQGGSIIPDVIGIISGHIVFYTLFILPVEMNKPFLKCPKFLVDWLDDNGFPNPQDVQRPQNPMAGRGRRIGD